MADIKLQLTLTDPDGLVLETWDCREDLDLPDLEELCQCWEFHTNANPEQQTFTPVELDDDFSDPLLDL